MIKVLFDAGIVQRFGDCPVSGGFRVRVNGQFRTVEKEDLYEMAGNDGQILGKLRQIDRVNFP